MNRGSNFIPNGMVSSETPFVAKVLDPKRWSKAEGRTRDLLTHIQPNHISETCRNAVVSYLRSLIMNSVPCQVFPFGSVPLKTYIPDGDIDLTAFCDNHHSEDRLIQDIQRILEREEKNQDAQFQVKEVKYIGAKVKIIKCLVENFVVDISFNQIGGLGTLCFIEEVDNLINQNHLLKRSIILIKSWCFYESRILGSYHGLLSTYALETLVIYVFHVYNSTFAGPLEVLYRFLDFFSKFDWSKYCLSLRGPVPISSLPNMKAEPPRKDCQRLLLNHQFLDACESMYGILCSSKELKEKPFVSKYIRIVDPLLPNNNIGGSIRKGNFSRIKSAIALGAKRIQRLLACPEDNVIAEFDLFFKNTWERNGKGYWIDALTYNRYIRNGHVTTTGEHYGIYKNLSNLSEESKQMLGPSDELAASQTLRSKHGGVFTGTLAFDMKHTNTIKNALANRDKSAICSSYEVRDTPYFPGFYSSSEFGPLYSEASTHHCNRARVSSENYQPFGQISYDWRNEYEDDPEYSSSGYYCKFGLDVNDETVCPVDGAMLMQQEKFGFPYFNEYLQAPVNVNPCVPFPLPHVLASGYMHENSFGMFREDASSSEYFPGYNMPHYHNTAPFPFARPFYEGEFTEPFDYSPPVPHPDHQRQMDINKGSSSGNSSWQTCASSYTPKVYENTSTEAINSDFKALQLGKKLLKTAPNSSIPNLVGPSSPSQRTVDDQRFQPVADGSSGPSFQVPSMFPFYNLPTGTETTFAARNNVGMMHAGLGNLYPPESNASHDTAATSGYFVNEGYDILDSDFLSYWWNLQYGRFCKNQISKVPFPPFATVPMHLRAQFAGHMKPQRGIMNMEHLQTPVPVIPYGDVSPLYGNINERVGFWLPRTSDGTGTYFPKTNFSSYYESQPRFCKKNRLPISPYIQNPKYEKKDNRSERDKNLHLNSKERFPSYGQLHGKFEKPGSSESSHRGESSERGSSEAEKPGTDSKSTSRHEPSSSNRLWFRQEGKPINKRR
ncbi:uncharacterized protein LOC124822671 [Vigna umbellata]|uniref:uncharacterized protein LOC124822671 n=1 Tax=Vigna umbellata TaxID=87088 RepID=UPI001F5EE163|nr:uncharacterized protein LOC124822671 [Vigna umbellata]